MGLLYSATDGARLAQEDEPKNSYRSPFRRDYGRLIHSPVFRRLQGKTQLFPGIESDFFRNRLTHSVEVAQVAKSIALRLNGEVAEFKREPINADIVEFAGIAHDLGHPPFGHNGEAALDRQMCGDGGFEGNAQTLRILTRLEKKRLVASVDGDAKRIGMMTDGTDCRVGLNLTARSLAAILKYDRPIAATRDPGSDVSKGYYSSEAVTVQWIRDQVLGAAHCKRELKTIECQIMDLADDIAYSTYDLEDAFKAGFLTPLALVAFELPFREEVAASITKKTELKLTAQDVLAELIGVFSDMTKLTASEGIELATLIHNYSNEVASNGYLRTGCTAELVGQAVEAVRVDYDKDCPALSKVYLEESVLRRVETLKHVTYKVIIESPRLKVTEYRGGEIVNSIFDALVKKGGDRLLPDDFRQLYTRSRNNRQARMRTICDFIAGMTDSYALEFYARLKSENASSIFKPI